MTLIPQFQPIIDSWTNEVVGYESTIKGSSNESARSLFRKAFIKGETVELDQQARKLAIQEGLSLLEGNQKLFINISPQSITEIHHSKWWGRDISSIPFDKIVLELTESAPINVKKLKKETSQLQEQGLGLAIDDFGRGFSNYEILAKMGNINYIKLDKMFTSNCHKSRYLNIVKHIVRMNQDFDCISHKSEVIAEGIEHEWQKDLLQSVGVRYMQGFLFGYPKPVNEY